MMMVAASLVLAAPAVQAAEPAKDGGGMLAKADANGDGRLDKAELTKLFEARAAKRGDTAPVDPAKVDAFFQKADANGDGGIDAGELAALRAANESKPAAEK